MYQFPSNIFAAIRANRQEFFDYDVEIVTGYNFNQYDTVKKITMLYASQYPSGNYIEINGVKYRRPYGNIVKWRCDVWTKMLDWDVKDFMLVPDDPAFDWKVYLLAQEVKKYLKKSKMGQTINEVVRYLPIYGSVVLRKTKHGAEIVELRNLMNEPTAKCLEEARYVIIKHMVTPEQLRKKKNIYKNTDIAIERYATYYAPNYDDDTKIYDTYAATPYVPLYEAFLEVPLSWKTGRASDEDEWVKRRYIVAGLDDIDTDDKGRVKAENGLILFEEDVKEWPFKEVHASKVEGRWLGVGVVEDLFEAQRLKNRYLELQDRATELSSLILMQTQDFAIQKNLMSDAENGDVILAERPLTRVDTRAYNLNDFSVLNREVDVLADRLTFSTELLSGEAPPASATATAVMNQINQATSVFDVKRENVGLFLEEYVKELVIPEITSKINSQHILRLASDSSEVDKMRAMIVNAQVVKLQRKYAEQTGRRMKEEDVEEARKKFEERLSQSIDKIKVNVGKNFYEDIVEGQDYDLVLSGENRNVKVQLAQASELLGILGSNPDILKNAVARRILFRYMSAIGLPISELNALEGQVAAQPEVESPEEEAAEGPEEGEGAPAPAQAGPAPTAEELVASLDNMRANL